MLLTCNIKRIKGEVHKIGDFDGTYKRGFFGKWLGEWLGERFGEGFGEIFPPLLQILNSNLIERTISSKETTKLQIKYIFIQKKALFYHQTWENTVKRTTLLDTKQML